MKSKSQIVTEIDQRARSIVVRFKTCEYELIEVFEAAEKFRVHTALGYSSLFMYATSGLGLSEEVAYIYINVARKVREVPELKAAISRGAVSVSKARRISSVLTRENQKHWLPLAEKLSKRELEKMVAAENPKAEIIEKASYVSRDRVQLQLGVSEKLMLELRRAQDLLSQQKRRSVSLEETLAAAVGQFIDRRDPLARAKRQAARGKLATETAKTAPPKQPPATELCPGTVDKTVTKKRPPILASTRHKLMIQFAGQCGHKNPDGSACTHRRFLDVHHIQPVSEGGKSNLENLEVLCSGHHRAKHQKM